MTRMLHGLVRMMDERFTVTAAVHRERGLETALAR